MRTFSLISLHLPAMTTYSQPLVSDALQKAVQAGRICSRGVVSDEVLQMARKESAGYLCVQLFATIPRAPPSYADRHSPICDGRWGCPEKHILGVKEALQQCRM